MTAKNDRDSDSDAPQGAGARNGARRIANTMSKYLHARSAGLGGARPAGDDRGPLGALVPAAGVDPRSSDDRFVAHRRDRAAGRVDGTPAAAVAAHRRGRHSRGAQPSGRSALSRAAHRPRPRRAAAFVNPAAHDRRHPIDCAAGRVVDLRVANRARQRRSRVCRQQAGHPAARRAVRHHAARRRRRRHRSDAA